MTEEQNEPGQRLAERLFRRASRRLLIGPGSSFYKRFGFADPFAVEEDASDQEGFVFLSGASYYSERDAWLGKYSDLYARLGFSSGQGRTAAWLSRGSTGVRSRLVELALAGMSEPVLLGRHDLDEEEPELEPTAAPKRRRAVSPKRVSRKLQSLRELLTELGPRLSDALLRSFEAVALEQAEGGQPISESRVVRATLKQLPAPIARTVRQRLRRRAERRPDDLVSHVEVASGRGAPPRSASQRGLRRVIRAPRAARRAPSSTRSRRAAVALEPWIPGTPAASLGGWEDAPTPNWATSLEPLPVERPGDRKQWAPDVVWLETGEDLEDEAVTDSGPSPSRRGARWSAVERVAERVGRRTLMDLRPATPPVPRTHSTDTGSHPERAERIRSVVHAAARAVPETSDHVDLAASPVRSTKFSQMSSAPDLVLPLFLQASEEEGEQWVRASTHRKERGGTSVEARDVRPRVAASRHAAARRVDESAEGLLVSPVQAPRSSRGKQQAVRGGPSRLRAASEVVSTVRAVRRAAQQVRRDRLGRAMVSPAALVGAQSKSPVNRTRSTEPPTFLSQVPATGDTLTPAPVRRVRGTKQKEQTAAPAPVRRHTGEPSPRQGVVSERPEVRSASLEQRTLAPASAAVARMVRSTEGSPTRSILPELSVPTEPLSSVGTESPVVRAARRREATSWARPSMLESPVSYLLEPAQEEFTLAEPAGLEVAEASSAEGARPRSGPRARVTPEAGRLLEQGAGPRGDRDSTAVRSNSMVRASQRTVTSVTRSERGILPRILQSEGVIESPQVSETPTRRLVSSPIEASPVQDPSPLHRVAMRRGAGRPVVGSPLPPPLAYLETGVSADAEPGDTAAKQAASKVGTARETSLPRPMARAAARARPASSRGRELLSASPVEQVRWPAGLWFDDPIDPEQLPLSVVGGDGVTRVWATPEMVSGQSALSEPSPREDHAKPVREVLGVEGRATLTPEGFEQAHPPVREVRPPGAARRAARRLQVLDALTEDTQALLPRPMAHVTSWAEPERMTGPPLGSLWAQEDEFSDANSMAGFTEELVLSLPVAEEDSPVSVDNSRRARRRRRGPSFRPSRRAQARMRESTHAPEWGWRDLEREPVGIAVDADVTDPAVMRMLATPGQPTVVSAKEGVSPDKSDTPRRHPGQRPVARASRRGQRLIRRDSRGKALLAPASPTMDVAEAASLESAGTPEESLLGGRGRSPQLTALTAQEPLEIGAAEAETSGRLQQSTMDPQDRAQPSSLVASGLDDASLEPRGFSWRALERAANPVGVLPSVQRAWDASETESWEAGLGLAMPLASVPDPDVEGVPATGRPLRASTPALKPSRRPEPGLSEWTQTPVSRRRRRKGRATMRGAALDEAGQDPTLLEGDWGEEPEEDGWESPVALAEARLTEQGVQRAVRTSGSLLTALARASRPEEVVRAILERSDQVGGLGKVLPNSAARLVERIALAGQSPGGLETPAEDEGRGRDVAGQGRRRASRRRGGQARTGLRPSRVYRGSMSTPTASSEGHKGVGSNQVMKLAGKLMNLIHLAESERRLSEAQAHVRMAEDTDSARAEGSMEAAGEESSAPIDITTLKKTVLDSVMREIELLQARREDPDGNQWW